MFTFQWPWLILLLPLPLLVWHFLPKRQSIQTNIPKLRFPALAQIEQAFSGITTPTTLTPKYWLKWGLLAVCWLGLVFSLMYPQLLDKHVEVSETGYDLMLAVDLSGSMEVEDFFTPQRQRLTRIAAVKTVLQPFIEKRAGDRLGLILFADHAYLQAPLTLDNIAVQQLLQKAIIGMAGRETAIGDAIGLAVKKLKDRPEGSRVLVLLTDGDNNAGSLKPLQAAKLAKQYDIRIYTIGVGSQRLRRRFNEKPLQEIAKLTGGEYFPATDLGALANVYTHIDQTLTKTEAESRVYLQRTSLYHYPLAMAMIALLMLQLMGYVKESS